MEGKKLEALRNLYSLSGLAKLLWNILSVYFSPPGSLAATLKTACDLRRTRRDEDTRKLHAKGWGRLGIIEEMGIEI